MMHGQQNVKLRISVFSYHYHPTSAASPFTFIISHRLCVTLELDKAVK